MHSPVHISRNDPLGRFLAVPASLLGPSSSMRRSQGSLYRCTRWCTPRISSPRPRCCFLVGLAAADGSRSGDWLRSVSSGSRLSSPCCPRCRFHRRMATTSAGAWASLRHSICFSWRGRWPGSDAPWRSTDGTPSGRRGVGGIRSRGAAARVAHGLFDLAPGGRCCGAPGDAGAHLYAHGRARGVSLPRGDSESPDTLVGPRIGLGVAAGVFGLAHLPDLRYVLLATLAGIGYGWVYARTGKITASALTHTGVNWIWGCSCRTREREDDDLAGNAWHAAGRLKRALT